MKTNKIKNNNKLDTKQIIKIALSGVMFAVVFISLVVFVGNSSTDKIKQNQEQELKKQLTQLVSGFDNDILQDRYIKKVYIYNSNQEITIYPAKLQNKTFAKLIKHTYPKGYSGDIKILTAIDNKFNVIGVRILSHKETPGLGDKIDKKKSNWVMKFNDTNLKDNIWEVKKNGGDFDSFTGATITPRAVVLAVKELLEVLQNDNEL